MNKQELTIGVVLIALMVAWPFVSPKLFPPSKQPVAAVASALTNKTISADAKPALSAPAAEAQSTSAPAAAPVAPVAKPVVAVPGKLLKLTNAAADFVFNSNGGTLHEVVLKKYPASVDRKTGPVKLEFTNVTALALLGIPGLDQPDPQAKATANDTEVRFERSAASGLKWVRTIKLEANYRLSINDVLTNAGPNTNVLGAWGIQLGAMGHVVSKDQNAQTYLGVDTVSPGGESIKLWGAKIPKWLKESGQTSVDHPLGVPVDWAAVKNKYFVQILRPDENATDASIFASGILDKVTEVWATLRFEPLTLQPGGVLERTYVAYVGPMNYSDLKALGYDSEGVLDYGWWAPIAKVLLGALHWLHNTIWPHNYGIAIILLTIFIRILFWPITHKSSVSMKKMQDLQPLVTELRKKHEKNPQKQQQEIMALYKQHKVSPLGGCLPMLIQIPVFIALFYVLRSAIELRFADFLWIKDLSEPENLFLGALPFGLGLNILPIVNALTMVWQQHITPATGDPAQRKMMMLMPLFMLFFFYSFASGLVLYWTTNQVLMIIQQLLMNRRQAAKAKAQTA